MPHLNSWHNSHFSVLKLRLRCQVLLEAIYEAHRVKIPSASRKKKVIAKNQSQDNKGLALLFSDTEINKSD